MKRTALVAFILACSPSPPLATKAASTPSTPAATIAASSNPADAAPPYVPSGKLLGAFRFETYGFIQPHSLALHSPLHVYEIACDKDEIAGTFRCAATTGLLAAAMKDAAAVSDFDVQRTKDCFKTDVRRADAAIVSMITRAYDDRKGESATTAARAELEAFAAKEGPTLWVIRMKQHLPGAACVCEGLDCCLGFIPTTAQTQAGHFETEVWVRPSQPISVPHRESVLAGTVGIYDASPRAEEIATFARSLDWKAALALAQQEAAAAPREAQSLALSNVIVAAFQARDMTVLAKAVADVAALGKAADMRAQSNAQSLGAIVRGEGWLDDACAP